MCNARLCSAYIIHHLRSTIKLCFSMPFGRKMKQRNGSAPVGESVEPCISTSGLSIGYSNQICCQLMVYEVDNMLSTTIVKNVRWWPGAREKKNIKNIFLEASVVLVHLAAEEDKRPTQIFPSLFHSQNFDIKVFKNVSEECLRVQKCPLENAKGQKGKINFWKAGLKGGYGPSGTVLWYSIWTGSTS